MKKIVNVVDDPFQQPLGGPGRSASPVNFDGFTIGDVLKQRNRQSRVVGVSTKDRAAILMSGRLGDAAFWFEEEGGNFITSTYYMDEAPDWLEQWNRRRMADSRAGTVWTRLIDDESQYRRYAGLDAVVGEWTAEDTVFPHRIPGTPPDPVFYKYVRRTPFADEMTLSVALSAMVAHDIGEDQFTDILAVSFSGTDLVGHEFGPDSQEVMDQLLRLDRLLGELLERIDRRTGLDRTMVVLSSDHGALPLVEVLEERGRGGRRSTRQVLLGVLEAAMLERHPNAQGVISAMEASGVYLDEGLIAARGLDRASIEATITDALEATGLVAAVYTHEQMAGGTPSDDPFLDLYRNSFVSSRSAHLTYRLAEHVYIDGADPGGTGHGTPYEYDRHIPIIFMGRGIQPGWYPDACGPEDIAPTLGHILGLEIPKEPAARILTEMLN